MKIRNGFISNSSSSSFVVDITGKDEKLVQALLFPEESYKEIAKEKYDNSDKEVSFEKYLSRVIKFLELDDDFITQDILLWNKKRHGNIIHFKTSMDNFKYDEYANWLGFEVLDLRN